MASKQTIAKAALLVGTLDITAAFIQVYAKTGKPPFVPILTFIAKALVGKESAMNTTALTVLGLLLHYLIAASFTVFFFLTVAKWKGAKKNWPLTGFLYGLFIWAVMNMGIVPLTKARPFPDFYANLSNILIGTGILIVCIGLPLAYINSKSRRETNRR